MKVKIEGNPSLVRDMNSGAVINTDISAVNEARKLKALRAKKEEEIETLKNDVAEIKSLLNKLVEKL